MRVEYGDIVSPILKIDPSTYDIHVVWEKKNNQGEYEGFYSCLNSETNLWSDPIKLIWEDKETGRVTSNMFEVRLAKLNEELNKRS